MSTSFEAHADHVTVATGQPVGAHFTMTIARLAPTTRPKRRVAFIVDMTPPMFAWAQGAPACAALPWSVAIDAVRRAAAMCGAQDRLSVHLVAPNQARAIVDVAPARDVERALSGLSIAVPTGPEKDHHAHHAERSVAVALEALADTHADEQPHVVFVGAGQRSSSELHPALHADALPRRVLRSALGVNAYEQSGIDSLHGALVRRLGTDLRLGLARRGHALEYGGGRLASLTRHGRVSWDSVLIAALFLDDGALDSAQGPGLAWARARFHPAPGVTLTSLAGGKASVEDGALVVHVWAVPPAPATTGIVVRADFTAPRAHGPWQAFFVEVEMMDGVRRDLRYSTPREYASVTVSDVAGERPQLRQRALSIANAWANTELAGTALVSVTGKP